MTIRDDRTEGQRAELPILIIGTDRILSGWGAASEGPSYAAWACTSDDAWRVERWVRSRHDMARVRVALAKCWRPKGPGHAHIYPVEKGHAALSF